MKRSARKKFDFEKKRTCEELIKICTMDDIVNEQSIKLGKKTNVKIKIKIKKLIKHEKKISILWKRTQFFKNNFSLHI